MVPPGGLHREKDASERLSAVRLSWFVLKMKLTKDSLSWADLRVMGIVMRDAGVVWFGLRVIVGEGAGDVDCSDGGLGKAKGNSCDGWVFVGDVWSVRACFSLFGGDFGGIFFEG